MDTRRAAEQYEREPRDDILGPEVEPAPSAPQPPSEQKEVPTFAKFAKTFMATYAKANNKISEQTSKQSILDHRLLPRFADRRLDSFTVLDLDRMKAEMLEEEYGRKSGPIAALRAVHVAVPVVLRRVPRRSPLSWQTVPTSVA